ncbi:hypothetical protein BH24CHL6_BH24CHL6_12750 [soil metagenome]
MRKNTTRQRGQSVVELALFLPIMILILFAAVDMGRAFMAWVNVNNMARIGANYAAINPDGWQDGGNGVKQARYRDLMEADYERSGCEEDANLSAPDFDGFTFGSTVTVEVDCDFQLLTPLLASLLPGGSDTVPVRAEAIFTVRVGSAGGSPIGGGGLPSPVPPPSAPPTATPTPEITPEPTPTPDPNVTPDPNATPTPEITPEPTFPPVQIDFYGTPTSEDSQGGGPAPSPGLENIFGTPTLNVTFTNATVGDQWECAWDYGDGTGSNTCAGTVFKSYTVRDFYHVTLTVNGQSLTRPAYVLVGCKVPSFSGVRRNSAASLWTSPQAGFSAGNLTTLSGNGNYVIGYQSLAGGLLNPPGGCSDAQISVGP